MESIEVFRVLGAAGIRLDLTGDRLSAAPASRMTDELRELIRGHKPELVDFLHQAQATTAELVEAAMHACDHWGDGPAARGDMRRNVEATPMHLRPDLLQHFRQAYPREGSAS